MTRIFVTVTEEDKAKLQGMAAACGVNVSEFVRTATGLQPLKHGGGTRKKLK
jgi:hypothetical protein